MKERLLQLLDMEHLSPSKFADLIGVQRSSVSHILSGRNKPSFDFLQKTLTTFPGLKADWLMLGQGHMYEQMGRDESGDLFNQAVDSTRNNDIIDSAPTSAPADAPEDERPNKISESPVAGLTSISDDIREADSGTELKSDSHEIVRVMLFFDNGTFISYKPSH